MNNHPEYIEQNFEFTVAKGQNPERVDVYLTHSVQNATRTKVQRSINEGRVLINGKVAKQNSKIYPNDIIQCRILKPPPMELIPQDIPLDIVYEDDYLIVVNKPAGMVVHPGFGNRYGTLVNAILYYLGKRESIPINLTDEYDENDDEIDDAEIFESDEIRPGIVHRIDKNTSGLLVISKSPDVHIKLSQQFRDHTISREYWGIVWGKFPEPQSTINELIDRSTKDRKKYTVVKRGGKTATTEYEVLEEYEFSSLVKFKLHTGRTHQIRVHSAFMKHPIFGDDTYGGDKILYGGQSSYLRNKALKCLQLATRQMLHAKTLGFIHPITKENIDCDSELPEDFNNLLELLRER